MCSKKRFKETDLPIEGLTEHRIENLLKKKEELTGFIDETSSLKQKMQRFVEEKYYD